MATITISDLRPAGADLFSDSESYLTDLNDQDMMELLGGRNWYVGFSYKEFDDKNGKKGQSYVFCWWG
jgi:hypothetical protein